VRLRLQACRRMKNAIVEDVKLIEEHASDGERMMTILRVLARQARPA